MKTFCNRTALNSLVQICIESIVRNIERFSPKDLNRKIVANHANTIIDMLHIQSTPIELAGTLIRNERFWKQACSDRFLVTGSLLHNKHCARYFFEELLSRQIGNVDESNHQSLYDLVSALYNLL